ncbi:unnamed protein product [Acanthoscelides obtectus]|uniref:DDE Tnp4 domain-containing protein n=1 Tax=Acanthoscelides obtectus TaxID=200917 RepID=A0A9P0Q0A8_ACAOB|nr:unnamed protein product [Acanthoscelides obtectus]CAK1682805.1 hypothetical protein AOBTE_LOCUS33898 [Acanthoscelides obtectus]
MIYCSTICQGKGEEEMEKDNTNKEIIRELQQEVIEKDKYIASMKKRSLAFEDDVIEIEKNYNDDIQTYKRQIQNIEQQLAYLSSKNSTLQELTTSLLMEEPPVANDIRATSFQMKTTDMCKSQPIEHEFDEHQTESTFAHCASIVSPIPQLDGEVAAESARQTPTEFDDAPIIDIVPSGGSPTHNSRVNQHQRKIRDENLKIMNVNSRFPGSTHDSFIWSQSRDEGFLRTLSEEYMGSFYLLGDSGYPLRLWLITPYLPEPPQDTPESRFSKKIIRVSIE